LANFTFSDSLQNGGKRKDGKEGDVKEASK
jgi:hypothetical protein